mmetsp:Transcript_4416/g.14267  ORF Transcript_4416/g.14267 Transcript_4416/m.14267 type:complete len:186 (-) Transcript_4416:902-1459(-)
MHRRPRHLAALVDQHSGFVSEGVLHRGRILVRQRRLCTRVECHGFPAAFAASVASAASAASVPAAAAAFAAAAVAAIPATAALSAAALSVSVAFFASALAGAPAQTSAAAALSASVTLSAPALSAAATVHLRYTLCRGIHQQSRQMRQGPANRLVPSPLRLQHDSNLSPAEVDMRHLSYRLAQVH